VDSSGATIDFLLSAKRDAATAQRFLTKALGGENHPEPRVINSDKHAAYPPAIAVLQASGHLADNCQHRPVQSQRKPAFPLVLVWVAHHRRLRSDSYDSQGPGVRECGGCEGRSSSPAHSWSVRCDKLSFRSSTRPSVRRFDYKVATQPLLAECAHTVQAVQRLSRGEASQLNIGYVANVYHDLLPATLGAFRKACPRTAERIRHDACRAIRCSR
jgi:hypothetical protein